MAPNELDQMSGEVEALSVELKHYIQEDNWRFEQEVEEWEEEQSCKIPQMESSTSSASQDFSSSQGIPEKGIYAGDLVGFMLHSSSQSRALHLSEPCHGLPTGVQIELVLHNLTA